MGDVWDDFREKREMLVVTKDKSGLPGSHREGEFPWQGTGAVRRCAHSSGCGWGGRGAAGPVMNAEPENRPYLRTLRTQKVIKKGNELIIFIHFQVQAFVWMRQGNQVGELLVEVKARNPEIS